MVDARVPLPSHNLRRLFSRNRVPQHGVVGMSEQAPLTFAWEGGDSIPLANLPSIGRYLSIPPEYLNVAGEVSGHAQNLVGVAPTEASQHARRLPRPLLLSLTDKLGSALLTVKDKLSDRLGGLLYEDVIWYSAIVTVFGACIVATVVTHGIAAPVFIVLTLVVKLAREDMKDSKVNAYSTGSTGNVAVTQSSEDAAR